MQQHQDNLDLPGWRRVADVVSAPPLRDYFAGRLCATTSGWAFRVTSGWTVWELTHSPAMLGIAVFMLLTPQMLLAPLAGVVADRHDKSAVLGLVHLINGVIQAIVALLFFADMLTIGTLFPLLVVLGVSGSMDQVAARTIVGALVSEDDLATAISLNAVIYNVAGFIGPALAGVAMAHLGVGASFLCAAALSWLFVFALSRVPPIPPDAPEGAVRASFVDDFSDGLRYAFNDPLLRLLLVLHLASATLGRPFIEFMPALVSVLFKGGAGDLATLTSAVGVGSVVGGLWLAQRDHRRGMLSIVLGGMGTLTAALIAFAWNPVYWLAIVLAFVAGGGLILRAAGIQTIIQYEAARGMRGRAMSFYGLLLNAGSIIGSLVIGFFAELIGLQLALTLSVASALYVWHLLRGPLTHAMDARLRATGRA
jgi:MFS family permease